VVPYKRHCAETVENIVSGETADVCCDLATKRRIRTRWAEFSLYFTSMLASLRMKYGAVFSASPVPRETVRAAANAHLWVHTRSAVTPA
jgi:hypothetical protein